MSEDTISRQKTLDHLRKRLIQTANNNVGFVCDAGSTFEDASERVKTWLDEVPSIDAVPVVRCKDCKQCRKTILFGHFATVCDYWIKLTDDDGYCNHAERKEE